jgi:hypothetical protein
MFIPTSPTFQHSGLYGALPIIWTGVDAPAASNYFVKAPVGSQYIRKLSTGHSQTWTKVKNDGRIDDWCGVGMIAQHFTVAEFTDGTGGATKGVLALDDAIPAGAYVQVAFLQNLTGFAGDTSAVLTISDGTDVDRYNTGTPSVFTTAVMLDLGVPSGTKVHVAAVTPTLIITSASDFTAVVSEGNGKATIKIIYWI